MAGRQSSVVLLMCTVAKLLFQGTNAATKYTVGDSLGWTLPPNNSLGYYGDWANNKTFLLGDYLVFNWTGTHTVTEVDNEDEYNNCTKTGIVIVTRGGVIVPLNANGTRYFVCSVGNHCEQGMKVAIKVGNGISPPPLLPSAAPSLTVGSFLAVVPYSFLIFLFSYM